MRKLPNVSVLTAVLNPYKNKNKKNLKKNKNQSYVINMVFKRKK